MAQAEALISYGVQQKKIYAVKLQIEEVEEEQATCAPKCERLTELSQRIEEIEGLPHAQAYLKEKERQEAMGKQRAQAEAKRKRLRSLLAKGEEEMKTGKAESAWKLISELLSEADPQSHEAKEAGRLKTRFNAEDRGPERPGGEESLLDLAPTESEARPPARRLGAYIGSGTGGPLPPSRRDQQAQPHIRHGGLVGGG